jgi:ribosomal protein L20
MHVGIVEIVSTILEFSGSKDNAAVREHGMVHSNFINGLNKSGFLIHRKILAVPAVNNADRFSHIVEQAKKV